MNVAFEPEPVGRRRRLPDRAAVVGLLAIAFVTVAVLKPWAAAGPAAPSSAAPDASPSAPPSTSGLPGELSAPVLAVLPVHEAWGLRVVAAPSAGDDPAGLVHPSGGGSLFQRWTPVTPEPDGAEGERRPAAVVVADAAGPIRYLGLTSPSRDPVLDVRVSRIAPDVAEPRWLDVALTVDDLGLGEWLLPPPSVTGRELGEWPAGTYRIDVLRAGPIERLTVVIPGDGRRPASVPAPAPLPVHQDDAAALGMWPPGVGPGPVGLVMAGGQPVELPGRLGPPLDERSAWLAAATSDHDPAPAVVQAWVPGASGIGLRFPARARSVAADLVRLAPSIEAAYPDVRSGSVATNDGPVPWVIVDAPGGGTFAPGSYRLDVSWRDGSGDRTYSGSIHLELAPGPLGILPRWLSAGRGMAQWAGEDRFVVGISGRIEGASTDSLRRLLPERLDTAPMTAEALGDTCAGAVIADAGDAVLGLVHARARVPAAVRLQELLPAGQPRDTPVRATFDVVAGLVLIAPYEPWQAGRFLVTLAGVGWLRHSVICFGGPGLPLRVPGPSPSPAIAGSP